MFQLVLYLMCKCEKYVRTSCWIWILLLVAFRSSFSTLNLKKKGPSVFLSHNSDFFSQFVRLYIVILRKKKKRNQNCEIKSRKNLFLFHKCVRVHVRLQAARRQHYAARLRRKTRKQHQRRVIYVLFIDSLSDSSKPQRLACAVCV